jgi:hypothetical protein
MVDDLEDPRRHGPPFVLSEREMLEQWLEFHRTTLVLKCEGLDDAARKSRPVATSVLSLHGLVRHMAEVERNWFRRVLLDDPEASYLWLDPAVEDSELARSTTPTGGRTCRRGRPSATPVGWPPVPAGWRTRVSAGVSPARSGGSTCT